MRWSEKSPGLKILWVWTLGTAAILVANGVRNGIKQIENLSAAADQLQHQPNPCTDSVDSDELIREDKS